MGTEAFVGLIPNTAGGRALRSDARLRRITCIALNTFSSAPGVSFQTTVTEVGKVAESVFIAGLFVLAAKEMAVVAQWRGLGEEARCWEGEAAGMAVTVLERSWDGEWFLRAYDDFGQKVGSHQCREDKIHTESRGMCILAGIGLGDGRAGKELLSVSEHLATPYGIVLYQAACSQYYLQLGEISSYLPGYKKNAGISCHANPWIMIAEAIAGHGDNAHDYRLRIKPSARVEISDVNRCEPYVYAQMIAGSDAPTHGEAKNFWLTGTAAWNCVAITQWILGLRLTFDRLRMASVIPRDWSGFEVTRVFSGVTYHISVEHAGQGNEVSLTVEGRPLPRNVMTLPEDGQCEVWAKAVLT